MKEVILISAQKFASIDFEKHFVFCEPIQLHRNDISLLSASKGFPSRRGIVSGVYANVNGYVVKVLNYGKKSLVYLYKVDSVSEYLERAKRLSVRNPNLLPYWMR